MVRVITFLKSRLLTGEILCSCLGRSSSRTPSRLRHGSFAGPGQGGRVNGINGFDGFRRGRSTRRDLSRRTRFDLLRNRGPDRPACGRGRPGRTQGRCDRPDGRRRVSRQLAESSAKLGEIDADIRLLEWKLQRTAELTGATCRSKSSSSTAIWPSPRPSRSRRGRDPSASLRQFSSSTTITSPIDDTVIAAPVQNSEVIQAGSPIVTIANLQRMRIEAEVK